MTGESWRDRDRETFTFPGHWSYCDDDENGPCKWPTGDHQSPIDIDLSSVSRMDTVDGIKFVNYERPLQGEIVNNGHSGESVCQKAVSLTHFKFKQCV